MRVEVNGVKLFFDVEGARFVPDGGVMREKPTLVLLHGGPGGDHSSFKPAFSEYADICQVVYIDHRGNGRSERGDPALWNLAQWGDDIHEFCRALEIEKPIVMGHSFGGFVAIAYATRHPRHPGKLIFANTRAASRRYAERSIALFTEYGGPRVGELARQFHTVGVTPEVEQEWMAAAVPLYNRRSKPDPDAGKRAVMTTKVMRHFASGESQTFDMLDDLKAIQCPTLIIGGEGDPQVPIEYQEDIVNAIPPEFVRFERFEDCGHGFYRDQPEKASALLREFILS